MTKEHTPTPLRIGYLGRHIVDANDILFARCYDKEKAAHIVKCVNMHDDLVEALKKCGMLLEYGGFDLEFIDSTLKKAGAL